MVGKAPTAFLPASLPVLASGRFTPPLEAACEIWRGEQCQLRGAFSVGWPAATPPSSH